ncbi:Tetratricopeptide repeat protein [compost metagenome]
MIADAPEDPEAWHFLASTCWLAKDPSATLHAVAVLRRLQAGGARLPLAQQRTAHLVEAWALSGEGRFAEAIAVLESGLSLVPGFPEYHFERGRLRAQTGDTAGAIADFAACLAAPRGAADREGVTGYLAHAELVALHLQGGRADLAAAHLRLASDDPACPAEEAARMRAAAAQLPVAAPVAPEAEPSLEAAIASLEAGRHEDARLQALAWLAEDSRSAEGFLVLATALLSLGALDKALLAVAHALGLAVTATGYHLLGMVLAALGQPGYAERAFATALRLDPDHPAALAHRLACRGRQPEHPLAGPEAQAIERLLALASPSHQPV